MRALLGTALLLWPQAGATHRGWSIHFQVGLLGWLASWYIVSRSTVVAWSLDSFSQRPLLGLLKVPQHGSWVPGMTVLRQAVKRRSLVRTWLGNWQSAIFALFHWSEQLQSLPTFKGRGNRPHFMEGVSKNLWPSLNQSQWSFLSFSLFLFHAILLFLFLQNDKN